jgi:hypothetical protein
MICKWLKYFLAVIISSIAIRNHSSAQNTKVDEPVTPKWIDLRFGLVGDPGGKVMEFPAYSIGLAGNYKTKPVLFSVKLNFSKEILINAADYGPGAQLLDWGALIGKYFEGGKNGKRKILFSAGVGMIWLKHYSGGYPFSIEEKKSITIGFPLEAKIFWAKRKFGWGFELAANINPEISYLGGGLFFSYGVYH